MKPIRLSKHAIDQLFYRNITEEEVVEAITTSNWETAELGRLECKKNYLYEDEWNEKYYKIKQVRPIFVEEDDEIVVITIYTYFF
jgi:hypothetical protein